MLSTAHLYCLESTDLIRQRAPDSWPDLYLSLQLSTSVSLSKADALTNPWPRDTPLPWLYRPYFTNPNTSLYGFSLSFDSVTEYVSLRVRAVFFLFRGISNPYLDFSSLKSEMSSALGIHISALSSGTPLFTIFRLTCTKLPLSCGTLLLLRELKF